MAKLNRTCIVCSQKYEFCNSCKDHATLEPWHSIFHDNNCREIFNAVSMYGKDSDDVVKAKLDKCNLFNKDNFHKNIVKVIDELYSSEKKVDSVEEDTVVETIEVVEESVVEETMDIINEEVIDETVQENFEDQMETEIEVKPVYKNRKRK